MNADTPLAVHLDPALGATYGRLLRTSLPLSLSTSDRVEGALVGVSGGAEHWPEQAAAHIGAGARGVLVEDPRRVDPSALVALRAASREVPVVLRRPFLSDPALFADRVSWPEMSGILSVVSDRFLPPGADAVEAIFAHLSLTRAVVGAPVRVDTVWWDARGYTVTATLEDAAVVLGGIVSTQEPDRMRLRVLRPPQRLAIELPSDATSRPARIVHTDGAGDRIEPADFESAMRAAWRRLAAAVRDHGRPVDLDEFAADLDVHARAVTR